MADRIGIRSLARRLYTPGYPRRSQRKERWTRCCFESRFLTNNYTATPKMVMALSAKDLARFGVEYVIRLDGLDEAARRQILDSGRYILSPEGYERTLGSVVTPPKWLTPTVPFPDWSKLSDLQIKLVVAYLPTINVLECVGAERAEDMLGPPLSLAQMKTWRETGRKPETFAEARNLPVYVVGGGFGWSLR